MVCSWPCYTSETFRDKLCDGANPKVARLVRDADFEHCGTASAQCTATVPVLGQRLYSEDLRIALCFDDEKDTLAIQVAGKLAIGFPVGDFLNESLHVFTQQRSDGEQAVHPVKLTSVCIAQPGRHQQKALEGSKAKQADYLAAVHEVIAATSEMNLQKQPVMAPAVASSEIEAEELKKAKTLSRFLTPLHKQVLPLPRRVNLVCGGRYTIGKKNWGNASVAIESAAKVLTTASLRSHSDWKWKVVIQGMDPDKRAVRVVLRSHHKPKRSLRAADVVRFDLDLTTDEHRWRVVYDDDFLGVTDAVCRPFHLVSFKDVETPYYLTVDEDSLSVVLTKLKPQMLWEFFDAGASVKSVKVCTW